MEAASLEVREASTESAVQTSTTSAEIGPVQPYAKASIVAASTEASVEVVAIVAPETSVQASIASTQACSVGTSATPWKLR